MEAPEEFVLPLLREAARADDEAALEVAPSDEFLDQQARHDGLARTRVISKQETQRLAREHRLVNSGNLMGKRVNERGMNRQHRVEEMGEPDTVGLGDEAKEVAIAIKAPGTTNAHQIEGRLTLAIEQHRVGSAMCIFIGQLNGITAIPCDIDDRDHFIRQDAAKRCSSREVFQSHHVAYPSPLRQRRG